MSLMESQNKGESVNYVDMDLGGWDDAIVSTLPDDYSSAPRATLPSMHGFFDKANVYFAVYFVNTKIRAADEMWSSVYADRYTCTCEYKYMQIFAHVYFHINEYIYICSKNAVWNVCMYVHVHLHL